MKRLLFLLLILIASVWAGIKIVADPGYVLVSYQKWTIESPLWLGILILLVVFVILYFIFRIIAKSRRIGKRYSLWSKRRKQEKHREETNQGLLALAEGHWRQAETYLTHAAKRNENTLINYLAAAQAAHAQHAVQRRDKYLRKAKSSADYTELAISLTQAKMQIEEGQFETALSGLLELQQRYKKHPYLLQLLWKLYRKQNNWAKLIKLLPLIEKQTIIRPDDIEAVKSIGYSSIIIDYLSTKDLSGLQNYWNELPNTIRKQDKMAIAYAKAIYALDSNHFAEEIICKTLKKHWDDDLVTAYGLIASKDKVKQLKHAESWQRHHQDSAPLFVTLSRLAMRCELWGKAEEYIENSIAIHPNSMAYQLIAELHQQLGDQQEALSCYQKASEIS